MKPLAETLCQASYGKSADPLAPENQNDDWRRGYAVGLTKIGDGGSEDHIREEWEAIGKPSTLPNGFLEWKRGYWAGSFTRIDN